MWKIGIIPEVNRTKECPQSECNTELGVVVGVGVGRYNTFKQGTYNERDNRSTVAITKEDIVVYGCYHKALNKGGSTIAGALTFGTLWRPRT